MEEDEIEATWCQFAGRIERDGELPIWTWLAFEKAEGDAKPSPNKPTTFIASDGSIDRHRDVVDPETWLLGHYIRNNVILADHDHRHVIGKGAPWRNRNPETKKVIDLRIDVTWDEDDLNPLGKMIAHQHRNGFRKAVSVGFAPEEAINRTKLPSDHPLYVDPEKLNGYTWMAGYLYKKNELHEVSSVGVPANRNALQQSKEAHSAEETHKAMERLVRETTPESVAQLVLQAIRSDESVRRAILAIIASDALCETKTTTSGGYLPPFIGG